MMVLVIRFLAAADFCGSPSEAEYCMAPRMMEMVAIRPKVIDKSSIAGLIYLPTRSQWLLSQVTAAATGKFVLTDKGMAISRIAITERIILGILYCTYFLLAFDISIMKE